LKGEIDHNDDGLLFFFNHFVIIVDHPILKWRLY